MNKVAEGMQKSFKQIRLALEEHLLAINENTSEIQALFDYMGDMDNKIEKLAQRLDQIQLLDNENKFENLPKIIPLNHTERKIFRILYTEELPISYQELTVRAKLPLSIIPEYLSSLINKNIPITRTFINNQLFIKINPSFKERQAKENLINLSLESFM
tara:strand:+ start:498 stop:974 length:477 start_codon:yes stop_codon:yes gene_type:complete